MNQKGKMRCVKRIYEVVDQGISGNRITTIASNKIIEGDVLYNLLEADGIKEFLEHVEIINCKVVNVIPQKEYIPVISEKEEKLPELANFPDVKQRLWLMLHEMPDEFVPEDFVKYLVEKRYNKDKARNNVYHDLQKLVKLNKIKGTGRGKYQIIERDIYKDDLTFSENMEKLKRGEKIELGATGE